jgi:hypothetical protein
LISTWLYPVSFIFSNTVQATAQFQLSSEFSDRLFRAIFLRQ